jgi:Ni/Co efflux regulator RcnB
MLSKRLLYLACVALLLCAGPSVAFAQHGHDDDDHGHGHGRGHEKKADRDDGDRDQSRGRGHYRDHDRELHEWYDGHRDHLPPGLAKRDELPPGLQRQLVARGTLPPGLQKKMRPCPREVEQFLPPPPVGYVHTVIGGNIVLVNTRTFFVMDVFHF